MKSKPIINVVATQCQPEDEEKFNKWYNEVHIPMLLKFKGIKEVTRYKLINGTEEYPKYLAIYKFQNQNVFQLFQTSSEIEATREEMMETWKGEGFKIRWLVQYEPIKTWKR